MDNKLLDAFLIFVRGLFMGSADIVPGVSGGTIALITGIYERLVGAISNIRFRWVKPLLKLDFKSFVSELKADIDFPFFIPLILGIGIAFLSLSKVIGYCLDVYTAYTFAFFLGLIIASAYILFTQIEELNIVNIVLVIVFAVLTWIFVGLNPIAANHSLPVLFLSAIVAICAMILPGISGSFILLLLGQYEYMLGCLSSFKLVEIIVFVVGAVIGLLGFSRFVKYAFENYRSATISVLMGIMVGTIHLPINNIMSSINGSSSFLILGLVIIGFALIYVLEMKFSIAD